LKTDPTTEVFRVGIFKNEKPGDGEKVMEKLRNDMTLFCKQADARMGADSFRCDAAAFQSEITPTFWVLDRSRHYVLGTAAGGAGNVEKMAALARRLEAKVSQWNPSFPADASAKPRPRGGQVVHMEGLDLKLPAACYDMGGDPREGHMACPQMSEQAFDAWLWPALKAQGWVRMPEKTAKPQNSLEAMSASLEHQMQQRLAVKGKQSLSVLFTPGGAATLMLSTTKGHIK
jgi:hypothetical protein